MEAAGFNGRRAANAVLDRAGSNKAPAPELPPYTPPEWEPLRRLDEQRHAHGQPNLFDLDQLTAPLLTLLGA